MFAKCVAVPMVLACLWGAPALAEETWFVTAKYADPAQLQAVASQFQHLIVDKKTQTVRTEASKNDIEALTAAGFEVQIDTQGTAKLREWEQALQQPGGMRSIPGYACYRTVEETYTTMNQLAANHPQLASVVDIGPSWEKTRNPNLGYTMKALRLTNQATNASIPDKANMVLLGSIHAREYTPAETLTRFGEWLVNSYGTDPEATWLMDHFRFHLVLQANPDGRKKAEAGSSWRKNTNNTNGSCGSSSFGVDLNRNFPFHWNTAPGGSSGDPCAETYRGPVRNSEPETQNLIAYVAGTPDGSGTYSGGVFLDRRPDSASVAAPDDYKGIFMDIHSYAQLVLWPWGDTSALAPNGPAMRTLGRRMAWFNSYTPQQSDELYATDGTTDDTMYGSLGVPAFTIELGVAFFESCTTYQNTTLPKNLAALRYAARNLQAPYRLPAGPDTTTVSVSPTSVAAGSPVTVTATVDDSRFNQSNGTEAIHTIASAAAYLDAAPWQPGASAQAMTAVDGSFNASSESVRITVNTSGLPAGVHTVFVQGTDSAGKPGTPNAVRFTVTGGTNAPPTANFGFAANGLTVTFTDSSTDSDGSIVARQWNFGDGTSSTATNPSKTYTAAGSYTVTLTVTDNAGATNTTSRTVTVTNGSNVPPTANFSFTTSALTATFTDASTDSDGSITARSWNFGDGTTSTATSPTKTYATAGTYTVTLTVTDNNGATNSTSRSVTVSSGDTVLQNGVPVTNLSGAAGSTRTYTLAVPAGASNLVITTSGGTGDADLYVRFGAAPTTSTYDCRPYQGGNAETCTFATPSAGTYYVMLRGYSAYSGLTLKASFTTGGGPFFENTTDVTITDNATVESPLTVAGVTGNAPAALQVGVTILHTYRGDLKVDLVAPNGTVFNLSNYSGGSADNIIQTFTVNASAVAANGTWKLRVNDNATNDVGKIDKWSLQF
ncbi:M14 family zinc carboxypeptidase [Tahibacter amnicola]|uniref:M14 family zinc carboxypeptidase n=1 Tax=Tahibacter amnicola TaxID=2976241 RepID=UPI00249DBFE3|nr:M14 family zinc carboxypeptidase [Tahibacter amnicola]